MNIKSKESINSKEFKNDRQFYFSQITESNCSVARAHSNAVKERSFGQRLQFRLVAPQYQKSEKFWK